MLGWIRFYILQIRIANLICNRYVRFQIQLSLPTWILLFFYYVFFYCGEMGQWLKSRTYTAFIHCGCYLAFIWRSSQSSCTVCHQGQMVMYLRWAAQVSNKAPPSGETNDTISGITVSRDLPLHTHTHKYKTVGGFPGSGVTGVILGSIACLEKKKKGIRMFLL